MRRLNVMTKLNVKIIGIVLLSMITMLAYSHYLYVNAVQQENRMLLEQVTEKLIQDWSFGSFEDVLKRQEALEQSPQEQIVSISRELQPELNRIIVPGKLIKFGYYSRQHNSIVAIGPQPDVFMLIAPAPGEWETLYETKQAQFAENKKSLVWHGVTSLVHLRPLEQNGVVIGHAFASINQDAVMTNIWKQTVNTFLGMFVMLLICIAVFRELFLQLKKSLSSFAEAMAEGKMQEIDCEIDELYPVLKYIGQQSARMMQLDRLNIIGEMAAGIAHEVRNPMTTVRGMLQFLGSKKELAVHKDKFELMICELDRANSIISEFLSIARNRNLEFVTKKLNEVVEDIQPLLEADALRNNCQIQLCLTETPPVLMDPNSIRQLILNLVRNSMDAMPQGGVIRISIRTHEDSTKVLLSVQDQGVGIPPEYQAKLGTPFFTTKENGTGLGLAVCYRIAQRHRALVTVESLAGQGTTFTIQFPLLQEGFRFDNP